MFNKIIFFSVIAIFTAIFCISCSSSEGTDKENNVSPDSLKYSKSIPPGTADIKAEIIEYSKEKDDIVCKLKILEVFAYGSSISPLPRGTEIDSYVSKNLLEKELKIINEGEIIHARVSQTRAFGDNEYWTIIMFNK
jgi:hypothetical protein